MVDYVEIEDPRDLRRLNNRLTAKLRNALVHSETRIIGHAQGSFEAKVRFLWSGGDEVFYWNGESSDDEPVAFNFFWARYAAGKGSAVH